MSIPVRKMPHIILHGIQLNMKLKELFWLHLLYKDLF